MAIVTTDNKYYTNIAKAIRQNAGITDTIRPVNMAVGVRKVYVVAYGEGREVGHGEGYREGHTAGYDEGYTSGSNDGSFAGYQNGYQEGYSEGCAIGHENGYTEGHATGYKAGFDEGYTDGQQALSCYLKGTASGCAVVLNDVLPVVHDITVKLSSDTVTDLSAVTVTRYGKNLFANDTDTLAEVTYITASGSVGTRIGYELDLPVGTYTVHAEGAGGDNDFIYGCVVDSENNRTQTVNILAAYTFNPVTFTIGKGNLFKLYNGVTSMDTSNARALFNKYNIQLEVGDTATDYEPYVEPVEVTPNADGTLAVPSVFPTTTLLTNTGATMACSYLRDVDTYLAETQAAMDAQGEE